MLPHLLRRTPKEEGFARYAWLYRKVAESAGGLPVPYSLLALAVGAQSRHRGVNVIAITGRKGVGKSALALLLSYVLYSTGCEDSDCVIDAVLNHLFFEPRKLFKRLTRYRPSDPRERISLIVLDDAGVWLSGMFYQIDRVQYVAMRSLLQLLRSHIANLVLTLPTLKELPRAVRAELTHLIHCVQLSPSTMRVSIYNMSTTPLTTYINKIYVSEIQYLKLFNKLEMVYGMYEVMRKEYVEKYYGMLEAYRARQGEGDDEEYEDNSPDEEEDSEG